MKSPIQQVGTIQLEAWTHLAHGLRSQLKPNGLLRIQPVGEKRGIQFNGVTPERFAEIIVGAQLLIVGSETFNTETGERHDWVSAASLESEGRFGQQPERIWSQIGYRAKLNSKDRANNICEAIRFHHLAAEIALRRISESYYALQQHVHISKTPVGHRIGTVGVIELYADVHSFFVNLASLRDYLASYVSEIILCIGACGGHSRLLKKVDGGKTGVEQIVRQFSDKDMKPIGLAQIGLYRDILVHQSPVGQLNEDWIDVVALRSPLPPKSGGVTLKLPGNPYDLQGKKVDALVLAHHALLKISEYSQLIALHSPLRPHMPSFKVEGGIMVEVLPED